MSTQSHIDKVNLQPIVLPYASHVGSAPIVFENLKPARNESQNSSNQIFFVKYQEILEQLEKLKQDFDVNNEIYNATYNFQPIIGQKYHLYEKPTGEKFISIIEPHQWRQKFLYSVTLNSEKIWVKL